MDNDNKRDINSELLSYLYDNLNSACDNTNDALDLDKFVKQRLCLHCTPSVMHHTAFSDDLPIGTSYRSEIHTKGSDTYPSFVCSKCGEEFETKDLDLAAFLKESGEIVARISNLLETYKLLVSAIPTSKISSHHIDDIKKVMFLHELSNDVYNRCENLVEVITKSDPDSRGPVNHLYNNCKKVSSPKLDFTGL